MQSPFFQVRSHLLVLSGHIFFGGRCTISHPEPDILECEVKWALRSTAVNKASGCDEIPAELFRSLKDYAIKVLHSLCQQIWKTHMWPQDWKRSTLIPIPRNDSTKECANYQTIALISHASKVMFNILQARLQHYANPEIPDVQVGFIKGRGTRYQIANIFWIIENARAFQKSIYLCFIDYTKAFDCVDHDKLWKALREMEMPDHLTCLLINLYAGQEATVRTLYGQLICSRTKTVYKRAACCHPVCLTCTLSTL